MWNKHQTVLQEGSMVVIKDDKLPPLRCQLRRVMKVTQDPIESHEDDDIECLVDLASAGPSQKATAPRSSSVDAGAKRRRTLEDDGQGDERLTELRNVSDRMREVLVETGTRMTKGNVMTLLERISEMETIVLRVMLENERLKGQLDECRVSEIRNVREKETL
ncbi:hypothetical protein CBL_20790, partial [Carabus blaptoides fortunei]